MPLIVLPEGNSSLHDLEYLDNFNAFARRPGLARQISLSYAPDSGRRTALAGRSSTAYRQKAMLCDADLPEGMDPIAVKS
jgi:hypothetical protein